MKTILQDITQDYKDEFVRIRHYLHENPEIGFEEINTSKFIENKLKEWGYSVTSGFAETGLVATLKVGNSRKVVGIRADIDALPMTENANNKSWCSKTIGRFHGCGHDGHTAILLCAAKYLSDKRNFDGTIHLIFQPAEETLCGGSKMLEDGLFEQFPCDRIFALHNMPGISKGKIVLKDNVAMASSDRIQIEVTGKSSHGAYPNQGIDATVTACYIATALQTIVSRNVSPFQPAVITIGSIQSGDAPNIVNEKAIMELTVRSFDPSTRKLLLNRISQIASHQAESFMAKAHVKHINGSPSLVNSTEVNLFVKNIAEKAFGKDCIIYLDSPMMGSEDFAFMLEKNPNGSYFFIGTGDVANLHNPDYDFNDDIIPIGATMWVGIVEKYLSK